MEPTRFEYSSPDSDGEFSFGVQFEITNTGDETAELLQRLFIFRDRNGLPVAESTNEEDCVIGPGETYSSDTDRSDYIAESLFAGDPSDARVNGHIRLCKLSFLKLPEFTLDTAPSSPTGLTDSFTVEDIVEVTGVAAWAKEPDGDGEVDIELRIGLRNLTDSGIPKIAVEAKLIDTRVRVLSESDSTCKLLAAEHYLCDLNFWNVKGKRLSDARVATTITMFTTVCEEELRGANPTPEDED